ncbi:hypothetical protein BDV25DRAFT_147439 [Aspergillus avenaceus]|uniref:Uncharacterized protein n=1 Tax=Aspergillus avenaceus TaxID=36643 RepID=A0A5N6U804_ASPAV|nr:hypothetical protein BDV25DRAFT_147439 [Aspergillus avenaceus]
MMASLLVYAGANLFMLDAYGPLYGASASGATMLSRYIMSFAFLCLHCGCFRLSVRAGELAFWPS